VRGVQGNIVVDDSYFDGPRLANGWEQDATSNAYMAPYGALSVGFNAVLVHVLPGAAGTDARILVEPDSGYAKLVGRHRRPRPSRHRPDDPGREDVPGPGA